MAGIGAGLAAVGLVSLFTRGADVNIESGTQVEMVLQRPLILEEENLGGVGAPGTLRLWFPRPTNPNRWTSQSAPACSARPGASVASNLE